jgi:hypothetical protein
MDGVPIHSGGLVAQLTERNPRRFILQMSKPILKSSPYLAPGTLLQIGEEGSATGN